MKLYIYIFLFLREKRTEASVKNLIGSDKKLSLVLLCFERKEAHAGTVKKREKLNVKMIIIATGKSKLLLHIKKKKRKEKRNCPIP